MLLMKIIISIDILPSEVFTILEKLKGQEKTPQPAPPEEPVRLVRVVDSPMNQENEFWNPRIGSIGRVVEEHGGLWNVQFIDDPFPCKDLDPQRFTRI